MQKTPHQAELQSERHHNCWASHSFAAGCLLQVPCRDPPPPPLLPCPPSSWHIHQCPPLESEEAPIIKGLHGWGGGQSLLLTVAPCNSGLADERRQSAFQKCAQNISRRRSSARLIQVSFQEGDHSCPWPPGSYTVRKERIYNKCSLFFLL